MKKNRLVKVLTSAALTAVMVASMGISAFAAESVKEIPLTKEVTTKEFTYLPNDAQFEFLLETGRDGELEAGKFGNVDGNSNNKTLKVTAGLSGGLTLSSEQITFDSNSLHTEIDGGWSYKKAATINIVESVFQASGVAPGIYHYTIREKLTEDGITQYEGMTYDDKTRDIYVYVFYDETTGMNYVSDVVVAINGEKVGDESGDTVDKGVKFTNDYGKDNNALHTVTVTKTVTGNQGERGRDFSFTVNMTSDTTGAGNYAVTKNNAVVATLNSENQYNTTLTLKDQEVFVIHGLSENDTYKVSETSYENEGYTTTFKVGDEEATKVLEVEGKTTADLAIGVENNKNVSSPTGIVLSFAPYILLVALAGVFGVSFLRKKREDF